MSGIFGIINLHGQPANPRDLQNMHDSLAHRGPDKSDIWIEGSVGFGQLMLCTTPESLSENLPWQDPESGLVITADARIDNREELASMLRIEPALASRWADSRYILEAFLRWGESCTDKLLGDFSFAVWDPKQQKLFCARDHVGSRPFYYYCLNGNFVFASSAMAVATVSCVPGQINAERVADFLAFDLEGVNDTCTFFSDVWRLPPAHCATFGCDGLKLRRYWIPDAYSELCLKTDDEYADALEQVLTSAIECRIRSHLPLASMISGGVDSSLVASIASGLLRARGLQLQTYSGISDDETDCRESRNIRLVISQGDFDSQLLKPADMSVMAEEISHVKSLIEDPFDSCGDLLTTMYIAARKRGAVVVMDGLDGDGIASLTSVYPSYLVREGKWIHAYREVRGLYKNYYQGQYPIWRDYVDAIRHLIAPKAYWRWRWEAGYRKMAQATTRESLVSKELVESVNYVERYRQYYSHFGASLAPSLRHAHIQRSVVPFLTAAVERYGRLAAYCGVEHRQPLLDKRVIEFCIALPWRQKVRNGWSKFALRRVANRYLPEEVVWRKGWDAIGWKFKKHWLSHNWQHNDELLTHEAARWDKYVDVKKLSQAKKERQELCLYGEKEAVVFYLLQWLSNHGRPKIYLDDVRR